MTIHPLSLTASRASASATPAASASAGAAGNYNAFLQLLITELRHQDPMKPMDPTQTVTQLATFSQVEQTMQTNTLLSSYANASALFQATALIGHTVSGPDGSNPGVVRSVMSTSNGLVAVLTDGRQIPINSDLRIS